MENNFRSQLPQTHLHSLFLTPNLSGFGFDRGHPSIWPGFRNPLSVEDFSSINSPFSVSAAHQLKASCPNNSTDWFNKAHDPRRAFAPMLNSSDNDLSQQRGTKRFLVFDQSGERTTMMLTSGPVGGTFGVPNARTPFDLKKEEPRTDDFDPLSPLMDGEDEMHEEDTEELNALLFSDSDDYYEDDDEVTSTGHSPMDLADEAREEVDSFARANKRQKLSNGEGLTTSNCHGKGSSNESYVCSALEDDAESICGDGEKKQAMQELGFSRKGKILESVSILRSIIPGSNGKDALSVIDEAIHYLRTLKVEAMALGLDPL